MSNDYCIQGPSGCKIARQARYLALSRIRGQSAFEAPHNFRVTSKPFDYRAIRNLLEIPNSVDIAINHRQRDLDEFFCPTPSGREVRRRDPVRKLENNFLRPVWKLVQ